MKKHIKYIIVTILTLCMLLAACTPVVPQINANDSAHTISVSWSQGVEGVTFTQGNERLFPKNGVITTSSDDDIDVQVSLSPGYRKAQPTIIVDGNVIDGNSVPSAAQKIEVSATRNGEVRLILGEGVGYRLDELRRINHSVGYTAIIGLYLQQGYRVNSSTRANVVVAGSEYCAISSLAEWGLDERQLKNDGYHSFYKVEVLEDTTIAVAGVIADTHSDDDYATLTHISGEGYSLQMLVDTNNDGISDAQQELTGSVRILKGTVVNLIIRRDSAYNANNAKLYANGTEIYGTQGDGFDGSDPLSGQLIYCLQVEQDLVLSVTGVQHAGQFVLHIMNSDGTQRYRTYCYADTVAQALAQIPGNDDRDSEFYAQYWQPDPGDGYSFEYWLFEGGVFKQIDTSYSPELYADIYCGYVAEGTVPSDPGDRPTIKPQPSVPTVPDNVDLPQPLLEAMRAVTRLSPDQLESKQWVLAWAAYQLYKAQIVDIGRPTEFIYDSIYNLWYDDLIKDAVGVSVNNLWVCAYDLLKNGASEIDPHALATDYLLKSSATGYTTRAANKEAFYLEIVGIMPQYPTKQSYAIGDTDMDINMSMVLLLDRLGVNWTLGYGNAVKNFANESELREYTEQNAHTQVMANVIQKVFDYIDSFGA